MTPHEKSIALICKDPAQSARILDVLRDIPRVHLEERSATLSEMNGKALHLAIDHDLIIFNTEDTRDNDIAAIRLIRKQTDGKAIVLALTNENTTLSDAHRLTEAGVNDVLPDTITREELLRQVDRWIIKKPAQTMPQTGPTAGAAGKVIAIAQARGGIGATTLAVNLADRLLERRGIVKKIAHKRVVLVDLDFQFGTVASSLDLPASDVLDRMARDGIMPDELFMQQSLAKLSSGLCVLTAPAGFLPLDALHRDQMTKMIELLRATFDYVVIDLPRTLVDWIGGVIEVTDLMLLVSDSSVPAIRNASRLINFYTEECPDLKIDVIVSYEKKPLLSHGHHTEAAKVLGRPLQGWLPFDPKSAREASDRGTPLSTAASGSALAKAINRLGDKITKSIISQADAAATH